MVSRFIYTGFIQVQCLSFTIFFFIALVTNTGHVNKWHYNGTGMYSGIFMLVALVLWQRVTEACVQIVLPYLSLARRTPSFSTVSRVSLRPAVSLSRTGKPPMSTHDSTMSLVVPATGDTMAAGRWPEQRYVDSQTRMKTHSTKTSCDWWRCFKSCLWNSVFWSKEFQMLCPCVLLILDFYLSFTHLQNPIYSTLVTKAWTLLHRLHTYFREMGEMR